ncbi:MAG TPA: phage head closure protein [Symbiobacteriaceae bacterium]|nr:phage head closure protein [Symbiobacteriaceae bacterium]
MIAAAQLRHRITLQEKQITQDTYGAEVENWVDVATVWAEVSPISGREYFAAQQVNAEVTHRIKLRYRAGVNSKMQVVFGTRIFGIESVINVGERNIEMQLMAVEVAA